MAVSIGIAKVVSLARYPEDGSVLLSDANVKVITMETIELKRWMHTVTTDEHTVKRKGVI
jgi:hypothetical protein